MSVLSDILNSVNKKSDYLDKEMVERDYPPFIINRGMSYFVDTILFANEMNKHAATPPWAQYNFFYHTIRKKSRFSKWHKKSKIKHLDIIKEYYQYGDVKAEQALELLTDEQIKTIQERLYKGGKRGKS